MADHLVNIVVTAEIQTAKSVRNFRVELTDLDESLQLVERLANWLNDEIGTKIVVSVDDTIECEKCGCLSDDSETLCWACGTPLNPNWRKND